MKITRSSSGKSYRYEIRIAGIGGQGIILAGIILAEAALQDGACVAQSQVYSPETRGGNSISEVILSNMEIDYPRALKLDLLVALTQEGCNRNLRDMKAEGLVIVDSDLVQKVLWGKVASLPLSQIAEQAGDSRATNAAALGAIVSFCPRISHHSLVKVMKKRLPSDKVALNLFAFEEALKLANKLKESLKLATTEPEFEI